MRFGILKHVVAVVCRDDLIFLIYLYQRWIYRVDMSRVNEFGFSGQQAEERAAEAAAAGQDGSSAALPNSIEVRQGSGCYER